MALYYLEHDGRVLIVERDGRIDLPTAKEVDVAFDEVARRTLNGEEVVFGNARLDKHPEHWPIKDHLVADHRCRPVVHAAIDATLFRPVVGVVVMNGDDVLLVRPARGVAEGHWVLPGGFLGAFESAEDGARRELREETGIDVDHLTLVGTTTYRHPPSPYPILGLAFVARTEQRALRPPPDEIAEARWVPLTDALVDGAAGFTSRVLQWMSKEGHV